MERPEFRRSFATPLVWRHDGAEELIVPGSICFESNSDTKSLTIDGMCWTGGDVATSSGAASNCSMQVNGALLMAGTSASVSGNYGGTISVVYQSNKVQVPDFSGANGTPQSVKIIQWGM